MVKDHHIAVAIGSAIALIIIGHKTYENVESLRNSAVVDIGIRARNIVRYLSGEE
jgi:hypothetical protein